MRNVDLTTSPNKAFYSQSKGRFLKIILPPRVDDFEMQFPSSITPNTSKGKSADTNLHSTQTHTHTLTWLSIWGK